MDLLEQNPVRDKVDIQFLTNEVLRLGVVLVRRARERKRHQSLLPGDGPAASFCGSVGKGHWRGSIPYLQIIMCLTQDSVKCLVLTRANSRAR
jgi:hypothetical protein